MLPEYWYSTVDTVIVGRKLCLRIESCPHSGLVS